MTDVASSVPVGHDPPGNEGTATPRRLAADPLVTVALIVPPFIVLGASDGGYFPSSWGWSALVFAWAAMLALILRERVALSRLEVWYLASLVALLAWTTLSLLWTPTVTGTVLDVERTLVYVTFAVALGVTVQRGGIRVLLGSVLVAIVGLSLYGLAARLAPGRLSTYDAFVTYRLSEPLGYWNAVAGLTAIGMVLASGFAARARHVVVRGLAAGSLVFLLPTFYFTFGRGGWLALFAGTLVAISLDPRRLQYVTALLLAAPWALAALWQANRATGLTTDFSPLGAATSDGKRLAWLLVVLAVGAFGTMVVGTLAAQKYEVPRRVRTTYTVALILMAAGLVLLGVVRFGGPLEIVHKARASLQQSSPNVRGDQTQRLLSLSSNGRFDLWRVALDAARDHPLQGIGAGAYEERWDRYRPVPAEVRDAHSLPIEVVGELGMVGLLLLGVTLAMPFIASLRARAHHPLAPVAAGCFAAYVVHASVDWDWEMPVLTLAGLACAGAVLIGSRDESPVLTLGRTTRSVCVSLLVVGSVVAFVGLVSNRALTQADHATDDDDGRAAYALAQTAARWAPWSSEPLKFQADATLSEGKPAAAAVLYRRAIAKDRSNWELWFGLALATKGAIRTAALAEAARLNPRSTQIRQLRESNGVR